MSETHLSNHEDETVISDLHRLSDDETSSVMKEISPSLTKEEFEYIKKTLKGFLRKNKTPVSLSELKIYASLTDETKRLTKNADLSDFVCDDEDVSDTYADIVQKINAVYRRGTFEHTLEGLAQVSGEYMEMIGRENTSVAVSNESTDTELFSLIRPDGTRALSFSKKEGSKGDGKLEGGLALVMLLPTGGSENGYAENVRTLTAEIKKVGVAVRPYLISEYGIMGVLFRDTKGARLDMTRLLPRDEYTPECTVKGFHGRYIYAVSKGDLELVSNMAGSHFLLSAYFAMTEESGYVETTKELPPSMKISLELLVKLSEYTTKREATVTECSLTKKNQYGKVFIKDGSEKAGTRLVSPCLKNDTALSARYTEPQSNAYAAGLFTALDCCLELVSKGVNRRAVCSACQYEFPKLSTDEASLGEDLTLILGVYRFNVEIASPASHASVKYGRKRSLIYASHAQIPKKLIPCELTDKGTKLCFMGIDILPSGIPSFKSFRDVCDRFSDLCASGRVLSAKAAFNGIEEAASALCGRVRVTMSENLCMLPKMGIVFEVESSEGLVEIGALERDPLSADTETEG